jgi:hypothetical protein
MPGGQRVRQGTLTILVLCVLAGCEMPTSTVREARPSYSRGGSSGQATVTSTNPTSAQRGTTLDVHILGSGFDPNSKAQWAIDGVPTGDVVVNSTTYVSSGEVVANVSIASDADITLYDVIVSAVGGKPGIGSELFLVALEETDLPTGGGGVSAAVAINDQGVIVGMTTDRSSARAGTQFPVRWNLVNGRWAMTKLASVASVRAMANAVNESNIVVGMSNFRATVWLPNGKSVDLGPGCATGINASSYIIGTEVTPTGYKGVVWIPTMGTWVPQYVPGAVDPWNTAPDYSCEFAPLKAINGSGTMTGIIEAGWTAAKWRALGPNGPWSDPILLAPGPYGTGMNTGAFAINEAGDIAGSHETPDYAPHVWLASGEEIHYSDTTAYSGFAFGINDSPQPDVVGGGSARVPFAFLGGASSRSRLSRLSRTGGAHYYDGAWDVSNATATQPLRIVGAVDGRPKLWTYR